MLRILSSLLIICLSATSFGQSVESTLCIGETRKINSVILSEERVINIYKPETYDADSPCDVFYLLDGSMDEDFIHISGLSQFFNMMYVMPNYMIVGIANVDRKRDFTFPTTVDKDKEKFPTTGGSEKFIDFIEKELQPFVKTRYNTSSNTFLMGQSLGGLLATEILFKRPELFNNYLIISPSLWWDNKSLLKEIESAPNKEKGQPKTIYIAVGSDEGKEMIHPAKKLYAIYYKKKTRTQKIVFNKLPDEDHATVLHQAISDAFKNLFPPRF